MALSAAAAASRLDCWLARHAGRNPRHTYAKYREEDLKKVTDAFADLGDFVGRKASKVGQKLTETDRNAMIEIIQNSSENPKKQ